MTASPHRPPARRTPAPVAAAAVVVAWLGAAPAARAQSVPPADATAPREQARQHFARAMELIEASLFLDAIPELEAARALAPTVPVLFNLGLAQRAVGRARAAIATFTELLRAGGAEISPERRAEVARYLTELSASLARVALRVAPATARVTLDGAAVPLAADGRAHLELDPGHHVVAADASGHEPAARALELQAGQREALELLLAPAAAGPPPGPPSTPVARASLRARARASAQPLLRPGYYLQVAGVALGGAGAALLVTALVVDLTALDGAVRAFRDAVDASDPRAFELQQRAVALQTVAALGYVAGGVALAAGAGLFVAGAVVGARGVHPAAPRPRVALVPTGAGVAVHGVWW